MQEKYSARLLVFMWLVAAAVSPLVALISWQALQVGTAAFSGHLGVVVAVFSVVLVAGEMWPIPVARGEESGDEITVSSTFGFALMLLAPVFYAVLAQAVALALDWRVRRRPWSSYPFNVAQYALAFSSARALYAALADEPFTPVPGTTPELLPALAAGVVFLLINNGLVGTAVSLRLRVGLLGVLAEDLSWQLMTSAPLLGLGPLAAQAALWTPLSMVLLLVPIVALHRSGRTSMRREQEALRDPLTGLANRTLLATSAERALEVSGDTTALLLIDLDHFKDVNDTLGHAVGDDLLIAVAERLGRVVAPADLVARLGGDEFVVLARRCTDQAGAEDLARRLGDAIRQPYEVHGVTLTVGCSIGIGLAPDHVGTVEGLLRCADVALYAAKATRGTHAVYDRHSDQHSAALLGLQADLRAALEDPDDTQIHVAYQPQRDLRTGRTHAVECLVRWTHPTLGNLTPDSFIPMAESTSLIDLLMRRVLTLGLAQVRDWEGRGLSITLAVNLSARQLSDLSLPATVGDLLAAHGVPAERLVLEVTESRLMSDPERSVEILRRLQLSGVSISIDDFGTGYSSLAYLQRLAVDELKIDRSFIADMRATGNATIVRSTIDLGHNLGLRVVAEGVEDQTDVDALTAMGCDMLQGYHLGRPGRAADIEPLLSPDVAEPAGTADAPPRRPLSLVSGVPAPRSASPVPSSESA